jgi:hypothetical protein
LQSLQSLNHVPTPEADLFPVFGRKFFDQLLAFGRKLNVPPAPIGLAGFASNEFTFHQTIDNIDRGVVLYLKSLAQLRNGQADRCVKTLDREQGFILFGIQAGGNAQEIFAETEKLANQVAKFGEGLVVVGIKMAHLAIKYRIC